MKKTTELDLSFQAKKKNQECVPTSNNFFFMFMYVYINSGFGCAMVIQFNSIQFEYVRVYRLVQTVEQRKND